LHVGDGRIREGIPAGGVVPVGIGFSGRAGSCGLLRRRQGLLLLLLPLPPAGFEPARRRRQQPDGWRAWAAAVGSASAVVSCCRCTLLVPGGGGGGGVGLLIGRLVGSYSRVRWRSGPLLLLRAVSERV